MESKDVKTLLLLEAIDTEEYQSQRELSRKLNISLGLVNTFIKNLSFRGICKTSKLSNNRIIYNLSSKGILEKEKLSIQYLSHSMHYYRETKRRVERLLTALEKNGKTKIIFYGAGELCEIACVALNGKKNRDVTIIDDSKAGGIICGIKISAEATLESFNFDAIVIMDFKNTPIARKKLRAIGVPQNKIYDLFHWHK
jgi:DNA-binding MarR family transcriptional regulator